MAIVCSRCGAKEGVMAVFSADLASGAYVCPACEQVSLQERARNADIARRELEKKRIAARQVLVTTTPHVDGFEVRRYLGIESVEFVIGTGLFSEVSSSIADFFGTRSSAFEKKLQEAKQHALDALKFIAHEKGANAVIGVDLDYAEFSNNRMALIINGTIVELSPRSSTASIDQLTAPRQSATNQVPTAGPNLAIPESIERTDGYVIWECRDCGGRSKASTADSGRLGKCARCKGPTIIPG